MRPGRRSALEVPGAGRLGALAAGIAVTRVARISGLDRTGVEVACAVRPLGHILQVSNGKGLTFEEAAQGALLEAAELHASERPPPDLLFTSARELRRLAADRVWSLDRCVSAGRPLKNQLSAH